MPKSRNPILALPRDGFWTVIPSRFHPVVHTRTDIRISGGRTETSMSQYDYWYSATTGTANAEVPLDGEWISYDCTMSAWQLQVESRLKL